LLALIARRRRQKMATAAAFCNAGADVSSSLLERLFHASERIQLQQGAERFVTYLERRQKGR